MRARGQIIAQGDKHCSAFLQKCHPSTIGSVHLKQTARTNEFKNGNLQRLHRFVLLYWQLQIFSRTWGDWPIDPATGGLLLLLFDRVSIKDTVLQRPTDSSLCIFRGW